MTRSPNQTPAPAGPERPSNDTDLTRPAPSPALPFERDESPASEGPAPAPRQIVEQAARDISRGLQDTERRGVPADVPGPTQDPDDPSCGVAEQAPPTESPGQGHQSGGGKKD